MSKLRMPKLHSLCVFCGSMAGGDPRYRQAATRLGEILAEHKMTLVYGGGHIGMMGALAEAALHGGARVVGVIPEHLTRVEAAFKEASELIVVDSMHTRKRKMVDLSDAFCILPGGFGTMDETFEILTWKQLRLHNKPIVLVNEGGYWTPLIALIDSIIEGGFANQLNRRLITVVDSIDEVVPAAQNEMMIAVGDSSLF